MEPDTPAIKLSGPSAAAAATDDTSMSLTYVEVGAVAEGVVLDVAGVVLSAT